MNPWAIVPVLIVAASLVVLLYYWGDLWWLLEHNTVLFKTLAVSVLLSGTVLILVGLWTVLNEFTQAIGLY